MSSLGEFHHPEEAPSKGSINRTGMGRVNRPSLVAAPLYMSLVSGMLNATARHKPGKAMACAGIKL